MKQQATMIYLIKGDEILFLERRKENDKVHKQGMHIPMGGKVEKGESLEDCIKREALEESGIKVNSVDLKGVIYFRDFGDYDADWIDYIFVSDDFEGEPKNGNEGNFIWVKQKDFKKLNLYDGDKIFIDYIFNKKYNLFVVEFLYKRYKLLDHKLLKAF